MMDYENASSEMGEPPAIEVRRNLGQPDDITAYVTSLFIALSAYEAARRCVLGLILTRKYRSENSGAFSLHFPGEAIVTPGDWPQADITSMSCANRQLATL